MSDGHHGAQRRATSENTLEADVADGDHAHSGGHELPVDPDVPEQAPASARRRRAVRVLRDRWDILLVIAAGGALGSLARWAVTTAIPHAPDGIPWATLLENVTGAFILGALMVLILDFWPPSRYLRPFLGVGVLGGYTTFSTYMLDTRTLLTEGRVPAAFGYLLGTLLTGLIAVWAGVLAARTAVGTIEKRHTHRHERRSGALGQAPARQPTPGQDPDQEPDRDPSTRSRP